MLESIDIHIFHISIWLECFTFYCYSQDNNNYESNWNTDEAMYHVLSIQNVCWSLVGGFRAINSFDDIVPRVSSFRMLKRLHLNGRQLIIENKHWIHPKWTMRHGAWVSIGCNIFLVFFFLFLSSDLWLNQNVETLKNLWFVMSVHYVGSLFVSVCVFAVDELMDIVIFFTENKIISEYD